MLHPDTGQERGCTPISLHRGVQRHAGTQAGVQASNLDLCWYKIGQVAFSLEACDNGSWKMQCGLRGARGTFLVSI